MTNSCLNLFILSSDSLNTSLPMTSAVQNSTYTTSVITSSSLTSSSLSSTSPVTTSSSYDQSSVHNRIAYQSSVSPSESAPGTITVIGLAGFFKLSLHLMWGSDLWPQDQELHAPPTKPARHPPLLRFLMYSANLFNKDLLSNYSVLGSVFSNEEKSSGN